VASKLDLEQHLHRVQEMQKLLEGTARVTPSLSTSCPATLSWLKKSTLRPETGKDQNEHTF
jgi:hypothetical protein